jgi:hypothetical protein
MSEQQLVTSGRRAADAQDPRPEPFKLAACDAVVDAVRGEPAADRLS